MSGIGAPPPFETEEADIASRDSFPASDPPANTGITGPGDGRPTVGGGDGSPEVPKPPRPEQTENLSGDANRWAEA